jgi:hypothetical protein
MLLFYNTKNYYNKVLYFPNIYNHTSLYDPTATCASVNPTSQVCSPIMLVLLMVGNWEVWFYSGASWHYLHTKFNPNPTSSSWVESTDRQMDRHMISPICIHFTHNKQRTFNKVWQLKWLRFKTWEMFIYVIMNNLYTGNWGSVKVCCNLL